jgi:hypothetical protein
MKFTFTSEFIGFGSPKNTMEFEVDQLGDVVSYFEQFLRGAGYHFDGHLDFVYDDEYVAEEIENEPEMYDSKDVMAMPGTVGGAKVVFGDEMHPVTSLEEKCNVKGCGLTRQQLGDHVCYDSKCGFKN